MNARTLVAVGALIVVGGGVAAQGGAPEVRVTPREDQRRVDVAVNGKPFTAYVWPEALKKPVLYPIVTARGTPVTRGFPMDPRPGERVDHPHHVGLWFNYGDVNGIDFWNNSTARSAEERKKMGTVRHERVVSSQSGQGQGSLEVEADWVMPDGTVALEERTRYVFGARGDDRWIDRETTLTARDDQVLFKDNKEGVLGLRVARQLEHPSTKPDVFTDASGNPTKVAKLDNTGVTGQYLTSEGKEGDAVWGTRGKWAMLSGRIGEEPVAVVILDHPKNPGHPTYWHARGYGLFAANPLGQAALSDGKETLNFSLKPKESVTFRHRILVLGGSPSAKDIEERYQKFVSGT